MGDFIPRGERPRCPSCNQTPRKIADGDLGVWWCGTDTCQVHQFEGYNE